MDFDAFLASPRWEILQIIAENPSSPVEISEKLHTTVSYISQQLKLLDAAGIVVKERTGAAAKGKPRAMFSISKDFLYLTILSKGFSKKALIHMEEHHKIIMRILSLEDISLHYPLEKLFWKIEEDLKEISGIFLDFSRGNIKIFIISDSKKVFSKIESFMKNFAKKFDVIFISEKQFVKSEKDSLLIIYDPTNLLKKLKGGKIIDG